MAVNYPGPYEARIFYTAATGTRQHVTRFSFDLVTPPNIGDDASTMDVVDRSGSNQTAAQMILLFANDMKLLYNSVSATIDYAEIWAYAPQSFDATYITTVPINITGSSASTTVNASQVIMTFRTTNGGIAKLTFMDTVWPLGPSEKYAVLGANIKLWVDTLLSPSWGIIGRDNGYLQSFLALHPGQNERLFKEIYR